MTVAGPLFLWVLALLAPVLVLFLVKRKRNVMRVPSTMVWRLGAKNVAKNRRIKNLRRFIALMACLLAVAALAVAAARPSAGRRGDLSIFVVDVSASMSGKPIDDARRYLTREIASVGPKDRVAIVTAGKEARVLLPPSTPGPIVDEALRALAAERSTSAMEEAIAYAEGLAAAAYARIVVVSDAPVDIESSRNTSKPYARVIARSATDNVGITSLFTRAAPAARDDEEREAIVTLATSSNKPRRVRLTLTQGGVALAERKIALGARGEINERFGIRGGGRIVAHVSAIDGTADVSPLDDEASLEEPVRKKPRIAFVTPTSGSPDDMGGAFFVERALRAVVGDELVTVIADGDPPKDIDMAVVLRDGKGRPRGVPTFYITVEPEGAALSTRLVQANEARLRSVATEDPLMRGVALDELTTLHARVAKPPRNTRVLVDLDGGPTMLAGGSGRDAWVWLGIEPEGSDLVLRVAFPVLVGNVVSQLSGANQVVVASTAPRSEVMLDAREMKAALPNAPEPRWRLPASPPVMLAALAIVLLALEAWLTFGRNPFGRGERRTT